MAPGRGRRLHGATTEQVREAVFVLRRQTAREKADDAQTLITHLQAIAADPHLFALADRIDEWTQRDPKVGGRPRKHPTWAVLLLGQSISVFGSAAAAARNLAEPGLWALVVKAALPNLPPDEPIPDRGPTRDQYGYLTRRLDGHLEHLTATQLVLGISRAHEVGLANPDGLSWSKPDRTRLVGIDGKVFSSPLRTTDTERVDRRTGEIRPIRQDPARGRHGEGGTEDVVWGSKYAIASIRSPMTGHRVVCGIQRITKDGRGEGGPFTDLAIDIASESPGVVGFVTDGALRGTHISTVQAATGRLVISPPRRKDKKHGGIITNGYGHAAKPLPASRARTKAFADCGHDLWAAGGGLFEKVLTVDGTPDYQPILRGGIKRQPKADGSWALYAEHRLKCAATGTTHKWWEPLTPVAADEASGFHRGEYLRAVAIDDTNYDRLYGMRADTESLNAQLEFAFHKQRLPAWGVHRQTIVILLAAMAQNAWALHVWQRAITRQHAPPPDLVA